MLDSFYAKSGEGRGTIVSLRLRSTFAFTLMELLIVVAIIMILAAIALPNYHGAQARAKVARSQSDMRVIGMALETYRLDHNAYPPWTQNLVVGSDDRHPNQIRYYRMTTPTAYLSEIPRDPFSTKANAFDWEKWGWAYDYVDSYDPKNGLLDPEAWGHAWRINSWGPDCTNGYAGRYIGCIDGRPEFLYSPTNGIISNGDIVRVGERDGPFQDYYCPIPNGD